MTTAAPFQGPVLVTGATGFIGSRLTRQLVALGVDVHVLVRPGSSLAQLGDARQRLTVHTHDGTTEGMLSIMQAARPALVYHLGSNFIAQHRSSDVAPLIQSNVLFGAQLAEAMVVAGSTRLVNTGTSWQHFQDADYRPVSLYAATKQAFEDILQFYTDATPLRAISLHLFDTYGPGDPRPKLMSILLKAARTGERVAMSEGEQHLDLVHIDDVVSAFLLAGARLFANDAPGHEVFAVSAGRTLSLRELVRLLGEVAGHALPIEFGVRPYREREVMTPWSGGDPVPGWVPRIGLDEGLRRLLADG